MNKHMTVNARSGSSPTVGGSRTAGPTMLGNIDSLTLEGRCRGILTDLASYHENLEKSAELTNNSTCYG